MEESFQKSYRKISESLKVLMVIPYPKARGPMYKISQLLIRELSNLDCKIRTVCWGQHKDNENLFQRIFGRLIDILIISQKLKYNSFDIMIINTSHNWYTLIRDVTLLIVTQKIRAATVIQFHGSQPEKLVTNGNILFKFISRLLLCHCCGGIVLSSEEKKQWEQFYPNKKFYVVSNPFKAEPIMKNKHCPISWNIQPEVKTLLFVGRLIREKGIIDLLESLALLKKKISIHLLIVGTGKNDLEIKKRAAALNLTKNITLTGYLEGNYLQAAYLCSDIFVLPSWSEGFPTVILEAMSAGLPIVTTGIRGVLDHLENGINAIFIPPNNPKELTKALETILFDQKMCENMTKANLEKVKIFSPPLVAQHYHNVIKRFV